VLLFEGVHIDHRSLNETRNESLHVRYGAVNQELLYNVLVAESFQEPDAELHVLLKRLSDDFHEVGDGLAFFGSHSCSQEESCEELE